MVARDGNTGGMYLGEAGIAEIGPSPMRFPCCCNIAAHGIGGKIEDVAISAAGQQDCMSEMPFQFAGDQVAGDDAACFSVDDDDIEHLMARKHLDTPERHLTFQRLICP